MKVEKKSLSLPDLNISLTTQNAVTGDIIHSHKEVGHSWTRNAWGMLMAALSGACGDGTGVFGAGHMAAKNMVAAVHSTAGMSIDTISVTVPTTSGWFNNATSSAFGILAGTGDTAFSVDDYILAAQIAHGTGSGQMLYANQLAPVQAYATKVWTITHKRNLINDSGASITVKELGLAWSGALFVNGTTARLMARDVLGSPVVVAGGELLTIEYDISVDFASID